MVTWLREILATPIYRTAFVDAVVGLLHDDELWIRIGRSVGEKAFRDYDWERIAVTWEQYLCQLTAGRRLRHRSLLRNSTFSIRVAGGE